MQHCHFSDLARGKAKDDVTLQEKGNTSADVQKTGLVMSKTNVQKSGTGSTEAKGRGTR